MPIRICLGGATGWTGSAIARAIQASDDLQLQSAVASSRPGRDLGEALGEGTWQVPIHDTVETAMGDCDVYIDYTRHQFEKAHVLLAIAAGKHVVIGTSGLTSTDYDEIAAAADPKKEEAKLVADYRAHFCSPYEAAKKAMINDVIAPAETRAVVSLALRNLLSKRETRPPKKHGTIPL